ncbi:MAG: hypothetical protein P1P90_06695 [Patescibacteria group bacterium]|nr:hypothetical protein [Patescibacteria group bacterium]
MKKDTIEVLIAKFERDMRSVEGAGIGLVVDIVDDSTAASVLIETGKEALPSIIAHLETKTPEQGSELEQAWVILLDWLSQAFQCAIRPPFEDGDLADWIAWAKKETA